MGAGTLKPPVDVEDLWPVMKVEALEASKRWRVPTRIVGLTPNVALRRVESAP